MVSAWLDGSEKIRPQDIVKRPTGIAKAIMRGDPTRAYPHVRRIVVESRGTFAAVSEQEIRDARRLVEELEGISPSFDAAAAVAGMIRRRKEGEIGADETVLVNLTGGDRPGTPPTDATLRLDRSDDGWDLSSVAGRLGLTRG